MATDFERLVVQLEARMDKFVKAMEDAPKHSDRAANAIERRFKDMESTLGKIGVGGFLGGLSAAAIVKFAVDAVHSLAEIGIEAKKAGVSVQGFQKVLFAAQQSGVGQDALVAGFAKLNLAIGQASSKGNELGAILKANGIELSSLEGDPVRALKAIADLTRNARNEQDKAVISEAAFGKGFRDLIPLLDEGSDGISKMMDESVRFGVVVDTELIAKAKEFDDAWSAAWTGFIQTGKARAVESVDEIGRILGGLRGVRLGGQKFEDSVVGQLIFPGKSPGGSVSRNPFDTERGRRSFRRPPTRRRWPTRRR
jgi:hypothetical protein